MLDVRLLKKGQRLRFIADFLEALYDKNTEAMHLFMDECDAYVPQKPFSPEQARALGAADELVRRGGIGGIGVTMISQRAQVVNKDVLSQVDSLTALRMNHPKDLAAIEDWIEGHVKAEQVKEMLTSLPSLPIGDAWRWSPDRSAFDRITVLPKETYDSGRTPKPGERARSPKVLAKIDLERLGAKMTEAVQRQKDNDPKELKKQIVDLRRDLDRVGKGQDRAETNEKANHAESIGLRTEVARLKEQLSARQKPTLSTGDLTRLEKIVARAETALAKQDTAVSRHHEAYQTALENYTKTSKSIVSATLVAIDDLRVKLTQPAPQPSADRADTVSIDRGTRPGVYKIKMPAQKPIMSKHTNGVPVAPPADPDLKPSPAHLRILSAIVWWESLGVAAPDLVGIAFVAGTTSTSSAFENNRSWLRARGLIEYPASGHAQLTSVGRSWAPNPSIPSTNEALHAAVLQKITPAVGRLLRGLIEVYPNEISFDEWAERGETSVTSSAFENNRSWLRARGLIAYTRSKFARASDLLFPEA